MYFWNGWLVFRWMRTLCRMLNFIFLNFLSCQSVLKQTSWNIYWAMSSRHPLNFSHFVVNCRICMYNACRNQQEILRNVHIFRYGAISFHCNCSNFVRILQPYSEHMKNYMKMNFNLDNICQPLSSILLNVHTK